MHICNGNGFTEDEEGVELADGDAARTKAIESARDIMAADVQRGLLDLTSFIEVEDEDRKLLFTVTFEEVVKVTARHNAAAAQSSSSS